jgi:hypothetical protein
MDEQQTAICPWCQTEIAWDEELGPEEQCPHCLNELSDYRSVNLTGPDDEEEYADGAEADSKSEPSASYAAGVASEDLYTMSAYEAAARHALDRQEVFADCVVCGVEMMHMGKLQAGNIVKQPDSLSEWKRPLLDGKLEMDAFVCPTCFRVETKLTDPARMQFVQQLTEQESQE